MKNVSITVKHKVILGFIIVAMAFGGGYLLGQGQLNSPYTAEDTPATDSQTTASEPEKLNLNTADYYELQELPGIGTETARAIVEFREANGIFNQLSDLVTLELISQETAEEISPLIEVTFP